jgi:hypothetical protein
LATACVLILLQDLRTRVQAFFAALQANARQCRMALFGGSRHKQTLGWTIVEAIAALIAAIVAV